MARLTNEHLHSEIKIVKNDMQYLKEGQIKIQEDITMIKKVLYYIVVDIPSTINISAYFSYKLGRTIRLPGEGKIDNINFDEFDIVFITPEEILQIKNRSVDMVINMDSLTEMTNETIKYYTQHISSVSKKYGSQKGKLQKTKSGGVVYIVTSPEEKLTH